MAFCKFLINKFSFIAESVLMNNLAQAGIRPQPFWATQNTIADDNNDAQSNGILLPLPNARPVVIAPWEDGYDGSEADEQIANNDGDNGSDSDEEFLPIQIPLGERDPETNKLVLSQQKTLPTAEAFIKEFYQHPLGQTLYSYAGEFWVWHDNRYKKVSKQSLRHRLQPWLHKALRFDGKGDGKKLIGFESNTNTIKWALDSIGDYAYLPEDMTPPTWLESGPDCPDPRELLPCRSSTLHVPTGNIIAPTPKLFNTNAVEFDYDPHAPVPERWLGFLNQLWGEDQESIDLVQEWFGYCSVGDTSQQKMLLIVGPRRAGKGTLGRILTQLVGRSNCCGPTTSSLAGPFGLQTLIGKSLALVSDARFSGPNVSTAIERLLCISGEDFVSVDRKYKDATTMMKLPTRFVFLSNELPQLNDASGAIAGRFLILRLTHSFYNREDPKLTEKLSAELPGILNWSVIGLQRLRARGHFQPATSGREAVQQLEDLASPISAFVRDHCVVGPGNRVTVEDLFAEWRRWCQDNGHGVGTKQTLGKNLIAAYPSIVCRKNNTTGRFYDGIALRD